MVSAQRDEMKAQGLRFMSEAEQMFHENAVVSSLVESAQKGYEAYAEAPASERKSMKQQYESQMLDARIRSDHAIEKCMATIESLSDHVGHQNRQTESLRLELRQSSLTLQRLRQSQSIVFRLGRRFFGVVDVFLAIVCFLAFCLRDQKI